MKDDYNRSSASSHVALPRLPQRYGGNSARRILLARMHPRGATHETRLDETQIPLSPRSDGDGREERRTDGSERGNEQHPEAGGSIRNELAVNGETGLELKGIK